MTQPRIGPLSGSVQAHVEPPVASAAFQVQCQLAEIRLLLDALAVSAGPAGHARMHRTRVERGSLLFSAGTSLDLRSGTEATGDTYAAMEYCRE